MGLLDKAKKLAGQARSKQKQTNSSGTTDQRDRVGGTDQHGAPSPAATPPHGDPLAGAQSTPPPAPDAPVAATPGVPRTEPLSGPPAPVEGAAPPPAPPGAPDTPAASPPSAGEEDEGRNAPGHTPPKLTGGDPPAG